MKFCLFTIYSFCHQPVRYLCCNWWKEKFVTLAVLNPTCFRDERLILYHIEHLVEMSKTWYYESIVPSSNCNISAPMYIKKKMNIAEEIWL